VSSPIWGSWPDIYYTLIITVLFLWGALCDERTGLSFLYAAGPRQRSLSRIRVPRDSLPYFTLSDLRLPFSSPPTTRRVTVEVFDPASTRVRLIKSKSKSHCDWRSVNQYVLVSSPTWGSWPDIYYSLAVTVLFLWGALSDERTGLTFVSSTANFYKPLVWHAGKHFNCCVTTNAWRHCLRGHVTLPFPILASSKCLELLSGNKRGEAMQRDEWLVSARLGTEKTPLRLLLRNPGSVFRCYSSCMA
jgi:hypothetical protein